MQKREVQGSADACLGRQGKAKFSPSRFAIDKKSGKPVFYRGNKRVEIGADGEWELAKNNW